MIVLNKNNYEVEETIQINNKNENKMLFEFVMQITPDEMGTIRDLIFSEETIKTQKQIERLRLEKKFDEAEKLEEELGNKAITDTEEVKKIIFKDNLEKVLEYTNKYEFEKLYSKILGFFINAFVKEKIAPINTTLTDLQNLTKNSTLYK